MHSTMLETQKTTSVTDFQSMSELRRQARDNPKQTLEQVARHFESLYLNMMMKSMRQASLGDPLFDSNSSGLYRDMYDQQIALQMSQQRGIGLADVLVKQLQGGLDSGNQSPEKLVDKTSQATANNGSFIKPEQASDLQRSNIKLRLYEVPLQEQESKDPVVFDSKQEFVETLMPYAENAAEQLGVAPQVLIAQAALETGWGQHINQLPNGQSSYNLFNIKSDQRWSGPSAVKATTEFYDGQAVKQQATFRAYDSYQQSFDDYVSFVKSNPRYKTAIAQAGQPEKYTVELQKAGYATDPDYANKINDIYQREVVGAPYSDYLMDV